MSLTPETLPINISSTSYTINAPSSLIVNFVLLNVSSTYTEIVMPFKLGDFSIPNCNYSKVNDTSIRITGFSTPSLTLTASNLTNPADNRPMGVKISQISNTTQTLVATNSVSYRMT